jgi:adenylate kinase
MKILMLAPPGGGKGTQGIRVAEEFGLEHISSGDLLRAAVAQDTPIGREVAQYMAAGQLAPDAVVTQAVKPMLDERDGYVLDGFPRNLEQTEGLEFDHVIYLDVPDEVVTERLLARGRADDSRDVIVNRLKQYEADTEPLVEHFRDRGVLRRVDGDRPVDAITEELLQLLRNA